MAVYFLKRYYKLIPTHGAVWSLGRDTAFEAKNNDEAIVMGKFQQASDVKPLGELVLVLDPDGKQIWESFQTDEVSSEQETAACRVTKLSVGRFCNGRSDDENAALRFPPNHPN